MVTCEIKICATEKTRSPWVRYDRRPCRDPVSLVLVFLHRQMHERKRRDGLPTEALLDERGDVREVVLVCEGRETVWADDSRELGLSTLLDLRVRRHSDVEGLQSGERLGVV